MSARKPVRRTYRRSKVEQSALEQQVVALALRLFTEEGYEAISMRRLAGEVGVAPMSLYRYFPSKSHLMQHIWQEVASRACQQGSERAHRVRTPVRRVRAFLDGFVDYWLEAREHYQVVFAFPVAGGDLERDPPRPDLAAVPELLEPLVAAAIDGGGTAARQQTRRLVEELYCLALGYLLAVIGLASTPPSQAQQLKGRLLDAAEQRLRAAAAPPSA